jgi:hypothetical protein
MGPISRSALSCVSVFVAFAARASAQINVPGTYADLQTALDAAPPGATIVVHGGTHTPININKPVRIVGNPQAVISNESAFPWGPPTQPSNITLAGPGLGTVELVNVKTSGTTFGFFQGTQGRRIEGGGFSELHLIQCNISAPVWCCVTGGAVGAAGISISQTNPIPYILVSHSTVGGGSSDTDGSAIFPISGAPGIVTTGTVSVLDSTVTGGNGANSNFPAGTVTPPPGGCPCPGLNGAGGAAVSATEIFTSGSTLTGGNGATIFDGGVSLGTQPNGPPTVSASVVSFANDLGDSGMPRLGTDWTLTWTGATDPELLLLSGVPCAPFYFDGLGWFFTNFSELHYINYVPAGPLPTSQTFAVPNNPAILGVEVVAQLWDSSTGLGRPLIRSIVP